MIFGSLFIVYLILLYFLYKRFSCSKEIHGFINKIISTEFEKSIKTALGHYPELRNVRIQFLVMKWKWFHSSALPHPLTFFLPKKWRCYIIIISNESKEEIAHGLLKNLSEKHQIGILGHELAHILDYENKNLLQISQILRWYISPAKRKQFENSIDILAIKHGIGPYLYGFYSHLVSKHSHHTEHFMKNYLSDEEIKRLTKELTGKDIF